MSNGSVATNVQLCPLPSVAHAMCTGQFRRFRMWAQFIVAVSGLLFASVAPAQGNTRGPPSILPQCLDPNLSFGVGPSARARECTRQNCARPEYRSFVEAYAMRRTQSEADLNRALTCITRWEQDQGKK